MMNYYVFIAPAAGEPYRFVKGVRRHWLFWQKVEYSWLPVTVSADDYAQLGHIVKAAEQETGRGVKVCLADKMGESCGDNLYWAVTDKDGMWFTGKWFRNDGRYKTADGKKPDKVAEVTADIREAQLFVRETFAIDQMRDLQRNGHEAAVVSVYVNTRNIFREPCVVIVCVNKERGTVRYLKSYKDGDHRLRYTEWLKDALLIDIEDAVPVYDKLASRHKELSFTMIVRPKADIPASKLREHEKDIKQAVAADFYIRKRK